MRTTWGEVIDLIHSPVHRRLAKIKLPDGETTMVVATEGVAIGSTIAVGGNVSLKPEQHHHLGQHP